MLSQFLKDSKSVDHTQSLNPQNQQSFLPADSALNLGSVPSNLNSSIAV